MRNYLYVSALLAFLLAGCGGGGGAGGTVATSDAPVKLKGVFLDSAVAGINYRTASGSGQTNAAGEFSYVSGETVTFSIGSVDLPPALASATITPLNLANTTDSNNQVVGNILVLLQSIDADGDPSNGIQILPAAHVAATSPIDFNVTPAAFRVSAAVTSLVTKSGSTNSAPVSLASATSHFETVLGISSATQSTNSSSPSGVATTGSASSTNVPVPAIAAARSSLALTANAGSAQNVLVGSITTLDGSGSTGESITYTWSFVKPVGSNATLINPTTVNPTFIADQNGTYSVSLVVNDKTSSSAPSTVIISASTGNIAPVAKAGVAQNVLTGTTVTLNGAASNDANGDAITYSWTFTSKPSGSSAALSSSTSVAPTFIADRAGSYVLGLTVNDGVLNSSASSVTITASTGNLPPVANAGGSLNVYVGTTVNLNGSGSYDPNGDAIQFGWGFVSKPAGSSALLYGDNTANPSLIPDVAGTYIIGLLVSDGNLISQMSTVAVTASPVAVSTGVNLLLFGGAGNAVYLGCATCNQYHAESICNKLGTYGNPYSASSIWNAYGTYGNPFSTTSPWNSYSLASPIIVATNNVSYGYFTTNVYRANRTTIPVFLNILNFYSSSNNLTTTRAYACGN
jgi:hypothetical protein